MHKKCNEHFPLGDQKLSCGQFSFSLAFGDWHIIMMVLKLRFTAKPCTHMTFRVCLFTLLYLIHAHTQMFMTAWNVCSRGATIALVTSEIRSAWKLERISVLKSKINNSWWIPWACQCMFLQKTGLGRGVFGVDLLLKGKKPKNLNKSQPRKFQSSSKQLSLLIN